VLLYFMLCGFHPFESISSKQLHNSILAEEYTLPSDLSKDAAYLIRGLLTKNPSDRLTLPEVVSCPWLNLTPPYNPPSQRLDESLLDQMIHEMGCEREFLVLSVKNRRLCNISTTYHLMRK
jgi:serine/threonine protein kinase